MNYNFTELLGCHSARIKADGNLMQIIADLTPEYLSSAPLKQKLFHIAHNLACIPICSHPSCTNPVTWDHRNNVYPQTCGYTCANKIRAADPSVINKKTLTNTKKYGGPAPACCVDVKNKIHDTKSTRYGQNYSKLFAAKSKTTMWDHYGVVNPSQLVGIKEKKKQTALKRYGVSHPMQSSVVKDKTKTTLNDRYGVNNINQLHLDPSVLLKLNNRDYMARLHIDEHQSIFDMATLLGVSVYAIYRYLKLHGIENQHYNNTNEVSRGHQEIVDFIKSLGITNIVVNDRVQIYPKELDIYLPDLNIAIEYNGNFWHSELFKDKRYHLGKTLDCDAKSIRLIQIMEDEWQNQKQQCKDTLTHLFGKSERGTYARNTTIREIPWKLAKDFLNQHHLLGSGTSGTYRFGAFDKNDVLIGVMVFGQQTNENSSGIELKRFVTNKKNNPGLGSKIFKHAINTMNTDRVYAFVDRRWFTGLVKQFIGFEQVGITDPVIWWTDGKQRKHRRFVTKRQILKTDGDLVVSKREYLRQRGYLRIWDCGKIKLMWQRS